jgi:hypothetical protein
VTLALVVAATGILAGGVVAARFASSGSADELDRALRAAPLERVAAIPAAPGAPSRSVFVQRAGGFVCLWDAPAAGSLTRQGSCNRESDPLAGREIFVSLSFDGGPAIEDVADARLIGLVSARVARVQVELSDGSTRDVALHRAKVGVHDLRAFGHRVRRSDLRQAVWPTAIVALDGAGREIDRQATGFGG